MKEIVAGLRKFQREVYPKKRELFERLATRQSPRVMMVTCADSRVNPGLIMQTPPGELFLLRNAGNFVPQYDALVGGEAATIEYAVTILGVEYIIVCGHSDCGAVTGLLNPEVVERVPGVATWLKHASNVRDTLEGIGALNATNALDIAIEQNVILQLDNLRTHPCVAEALAAGKLELHGWVYDIGSGEVRQYDAGQEKFVPL